MKQVKHITDGFAVSGALTPDDFAELAAMGFKSVISNLPDGESQGASDKPARQRQWPSARGSSTGTSP